MSSMRAKWPGVCPKCDTRWLQGDEIKPWFKPAGVVEGKMQFTRVPKAYVHAKCPKVTPNRPGQRVVDPLTGEILMSDSAPTQETML